MTSISSIFSTDKFLVSIPPISESPALLPSLTPSTSRAVPNAAFPSEEPPDLSERTLDAVRSGFTVFPPGSSAAISDILDIWRWFKASLDMIWEVLIPSLGLCAVTTTSSMARELMDILISNSSTLPFDSTLMVVST